MRIPLVRGDVAKAKARQRDALGAVVQTELEDPICRDGAPRCRKPAAERTRAFYENVVGLGFVADEEFALVFDAHGMMLRIQKAREVSPAPYTALGWKVADIRAAVAGLRERGVSFERYGFLQQDDDGIWATPNGAHVAWFKDPDGNLLSLTEFQRSR